ncbi:hypothetical protein GMORB2_4238 [Geosmithia morbida]|uniref:DNA mismatch repair protein HSM3 N-terminal domain-containing protein n=1 Tax=Geosmithia morbida TaxID=1094350 RepID=A0A9P4Z173_9HYPO|nr:uncharacterized protein GMORB2_4238 [Geosmithia morbida]KAF4125398.1 hypothetical protein GMORB2_4238 [Geosmithia morbida]
MDTISIHRLSELQTHLDDLTNDASTPFDAKLFDDVELQLTEDNIPPLLTALLPPLTTVLKSTTQDPTPCLSLTVKLLGPLTFARCLTIADPPSLTTALRSPLPGANLLALAVLHKAAASPADAAILSTMPDVFEDVLRCWLDAQDVGVAERAARVLGDVLEADCVVAPSQLNGATAIQPGHGRLWSLLLESRPTSTLIPRHATPSEQHPSDPPRTDRQISLSQGRILRLLPRLASLNLAAISGSDTALLPWAALAMVDRSDALMHLSLVDFFETLVSVMRVAPTRSSSSDATLSALVKAAVADDDKLVEALRTLPDRTVEDEAEPLREYIGSLLA